MDRTGRARYGLCFRCTGILLCCLIMGLCSSAYAGDQGSHHDLIYYPAYRLADMIRTGEVTASEVLEAYLDQISLRNKEVNAIVTLDIEGARERAREADEALLRGEIWGPLHGVPVTIKDNYATKAMRTTVSYPGHADYVPDFDATVVERIRKAGAIIIGKTNLPEMAMDYQTNSPVFGVTNNPWDLSRTPGGSTGGGAAAVASFMSALSLGNDLGGSIRIPSHFCGIYGLKPTENMVSKYGINPGFPRGRYHSARHFVSCGPLARSVDDLELCLKVIAGPDIKDQDVPYSPLVEPKRRDLKTLKIAWTDDFSGVGVTGDTRRALRHFADILEERGCTVRRTGPADFDMNDIWKTYGKIVDMEMGVESPWFFRLLSYVFGVFYRKDVPFLEMVYPATYDRYMEALTKRDSLVASLEGFLDEWDVWVCPVACTPAYGHIEPRRYFGPYPVYDKAISVDGEPVNYLVANGSYTTVFNLTGSPVVVIPIGYTPQGIPIGAQIVGRRWHDMELLMIAGLLDEAAGAYRRPPGY